MIHWHLIPRIDVGKLKWTLASSVMWWTLLLADQDQYLLIQHTCLDDLVICKLFSLMLPGSFLHCPTHSFLLIFMETSAGRNHFYAINTRFVSKVSYLHLNEIQYTGKLEPRINDQKAVNSEFSITKSRTNLSSYFKTRLWTLAMRYWCAMAGIDLDIKFKK